MEKALDVANLVRNQSLMKAFTRVFLKPEQIKLLKMQRNVSVIEAWSSSESDSNIDNRRLIDWLISKEGEAGPLVDTQESRIT